MIISQELALLVLSCLIAPAGHHTKSKGRRCDRHTDDPKTTRKNAGTLTLSPAACRHVFESRSVVRRCVPPLWLARDAGGTTFRLRIRCFDDIMYLYDNWYWYGSCGSITETKATRCPCLVPLLVSPFLFGKKETTGPDLVGDLRIPTAVVAWCYSNQSLSLIFQLVPFSRCQALHCEQLGLDGQIID